MFFVRFKATVSNFKLLFKACTVYALVFKNLIRGKLKCRSIIVFEEKYKIGRLQSKVVMLLNFTKNAKGVVP